MATVVAIPDLIELDSLIVGNTFTTAGEPGSRILGMSDTARYYDKSDKSDALDGYPRELSEDPHSYLMIGSAKYDVVRVYDATTPAVVTLGTGVAISSQNLLYMEIHHADSNTTRYFALLDDRFGNLPNIYSLTMGRTAPITGSSDVRNKVNNHYGTVCFCAGTLIATPQGARRVEDLASGDLVMTMDRGLQRLVWAGRTRLDGKALREMPRKAPIRIRAGALGPGVPERDLYVSPQHRMLVRSPPSEHAYEAPEVLVPAAKLLGQPGIERVSDAPRVDYVHLLFRRHEIVFANGAPAESLLFAEEAQKVLDPGALILARLLCQGARHPARDICESRDDVARLFNRPTRRGRLVPAHA